MGRSGAACRVNPSREDSNLDVSAGDVRAVEYPTGTGEPCVWTFNRTSRQRNPHLEPKESSDKTLLNLRTNQCPSIPSLFVEYYTKNIPKYTSFNILSQSIDIYFIYTSKYYQNVLNSYLRNFLDSGLGNPALNAPRAPDEQRKVRRTSNDRGVSDRVWRN